MQQAHFIGIGGVGMNGLAQLAVHQGYSVSGSDRAYAQTTPLFSALERQGITIAPQDGSGITAATELVVFSTAIESDNPDLQKARSLQIPCLHRARFLNRLIGTDELIAVAGTAGKTTTTGILGWIFECLGKDPSVYNGAAVLNWRSDSNPGNIRCGNSGLWIIEADESDRSFLQFRPNHSIITNISKDHFELDELNTLFNQFEQQTQGITLRGPLGKAAEIPIPMLGRHNVENALCAMQLCSELGMDMKVVAEAVKQFSGIERRLEVAGTVNDITIIDDYAHNPAKIRAALSSVAETYQSVRAFWRPHGFTPLHQNFNELIEVFSTYWKTYGGSLMILPVYYAGGTVQPKTTSADLVSQLNSAGIPAQHVETYDALFEQLSAQAGAGEAVLGMGARDPELPRFAQRLVKEWKIT